MPPPESVTSGEGTWEYLFGLPPNPGTDLEIFKLKKRETATFVPQGTNQWAVQPFKIVRNDDGTKTYYLAASDIARGIGVFSWTGPPNPKGSAPPAELMPAKASERSTMSGVPLAVLILMLVSLLRSRRSRRVV